MLESRTQSYEADSSAELTPRFDSKALRRTLGTFPTGVTVVSAMGTDGRPVGVTVNSFASVSLDPPLVLWSQAKSSPSHGHFARASSMVINILSAEQGALSNHFARPHPDKFAGIDHVPAACGAPVLKGCAATLFCRVVANLEGGDHTIHLCAIESFENHERSPLIFCKGTYIQSRTS